MVISSLRSLSDILSATLLLPGIPLLLVPIRLILGLDIVASYLARVSVGWSMMRGRRSGSSLGG